MATFNSTDNTGEHSKDTELQNINADGSIPAVRVANAEAAYNIYDKLKKQHESLAIQRAKIQGQQDGNAPYSRTQRRRLGLAWMSNTNFRGARSTTRKNATGIWNMFNSVPSFVSMTYKGPEDPQNPQPTENWGSIIAEEYTDLHRDCEDFHYNLLFRIDQMLMHGIGCVTWADEHTWKSDSIKVGNILFPLKNKSKTSGVDPICIRDSISAVDLLGKIGNGDPEKEEKAKEAGWNVQEVKRILIDAFHGQGQDWDKNYTINEWETTVSKIKNHEYELQPEFEELRIVHMLVVEHDKTVSHLAFAEKDPGKKGSSETKHKRKFVFENRSQFEKMSQAIHLLLFGIGTNGHLSSVRGLGYELYHTDDIMNRLTNDVLDGVKIGSGMVVQPQTGADLEKLSISKFGPMTVVPEELEIIQSSFTPQTDKNMLAIQLMSQIQNNNSGIFKARNDAILAGTKTERTATEVEAQEMNEARSETDQSAWYYVQWVIWHKETMRRLFAKDYPEDVDGYEERKDFFKRCIDRGVPKELLDLKYWKIKIVKAIGMGSPVQAARITNYTLGLISEMDEVGRRNALRDAMQVRHGPEGADRYFPLYDRNKIPTSEHSLANLENNDMLNGQPTVAGSDQPAAIHLTVHIERMISISEQLQQNPNALPIEQAVVYYQIALQHCFEHLQYLARSPSRKRDVKQFSDALQMLTEFAGNLEQQLAAAQQEQRRMLEERNKLLEEAAEQKKSQEFALEMEKIKSKERVAMADAASINNVRLAKLEGSLSAQFAKTAADIQRKNMMAIEEMQREQQKLQAEIAKLQQTITLEQ